MVKVHRVENLYALFFEMEGALY